MDVGAGGQAGYLFVHASYGGGDLGGQGEGWGGVVRGRRAVQVLRGFVPGRGGFEVKDVRGGWGGRGGWGELAGEGEDGCHGYSCR
jgi:hypothetical protein